MPRKNDLFCMSEGSYSDYRLAGHFRAAQDFSMKEVSRSFLATDLGTEPVLEYFDRTVRPYRRLEVPVQTGVRPVEKTLDSFQAYLLRKELVENVDVTEYYGGDYRFEEIDTD